MIPDGVEIVLDHFARPNDMFAVLGRDLTDSEAAAYHAIPPARKAARFAFLAARGRIHAGRVKYAWLKRGCRPGYAQGYRRARRRHGYGRFPSRRAP